LPTACTALPKCPLQARSRSSRAPSTRSPSCCSRRRGEPCAALGIPGVSSWRVAWGALARGRVAYVGLDVDQAGERACAIIARGLAEGSTEPHPRRPRRAVEAQLDHERRLDVVVAIVVGLVASASPSW